MDYFTQLLESYSKLKKRKLKLLEQQDANSVAQSEVKKAQALIPAPNHRQPYVVPKELTPGVTTGLAIFKTGQDIWKFAPLAKDGKVSLTHSKPISDPRFIGHFYQKPEGQKAEKTDDQADGQQPSLEQPEMPVDPSENEVEQIWAEAQGELGNCQGIIDTIGKPFDVWSGRGVEMVGVKQKKSLWEYVFGRQSGLKKLLNGVRRFKLINGRASLQKGKIDVGDRKLVSENIVKLLKLLNDKDTDWNSIENKNFLASTFRLTADGSVFVRVGLGDLGVSFRDRNGSFKLMLNAALEKANIEQSVITKVVSSVGGLNAARGSLFEIFPLMMDIISSLKRKENPQQRKLLEVLQSELEDKFASLSLANEAWTKLADEQALTEEESEVLAGLQILHPNGELDRKALIRALGLVHLRTSRLGVDVRVPYGLVTGDGERTDMFEGFKDREQGVTSLMSLGFSREESENALETRTLDELVSSGGLTAEQSQRIQTIYGVKGDTKLHMMSISMKAYIDASDIKLGTMTSGSFKTFIESDPNRNPLLQRAIASVGRATFDRARGVFREMESIYTSVDALQFNMSVTSVDGRSTQGVLTDVAKSVTDIISLNKDFESLFGSEAGRDELVKDLNNLAKRVMETSPGENNDRLQQLFKIALSSYLRGKKLHAMSQSEDPDVKRKARSYAALQTWGSMGCARQTIAAPVDLSTGTSRIFSQNDALKKITDPRGDWDQEIDENGNIYYRHKRNKEAKVTMRSSYRRRDGTSGGIGVTMSGHINAEAMELLSPEKMGETFISAGSLLAEFLRFQNDFMSKLLKLQ